MKETLVLRDEQDRTLPCEILKQFTLDDVPYALVTPLHQPIQILSWEEGDPEEDEDEEGEFGDSLLDPEPEELESVLPTAQAVLEELNLTLRKTAYVLTVEGEISEPTEEDVIEIANEEDDIDEYQVLTTFFSQETQYGVFAPLDPLLLFVVMPEGEDPHLLSPDTPGELLDRLQEHLIDLAE